MEDDGVRAGVVYQQHALHTLTSPDPPLMAETKCLWNWGNTTTGLTYSNIAYNAVQCIIPALWSLWSVARVKCQWKSRPILFVKTILRDAVLGSQNRQTISRNDHKLQHSIRIQSERWWFKRHTFQNANFGLVYSVHWTVIFSFRIAKY